MPHGSSDKRFYIFAACVIAALAVVGLVNLYQATPGPGGVYLLNAGLMWLLPLAIAVFGAIFFMNNLTNAKSSVKDQLAVVPRPPT